MNIIRDHDQRFKLMFKEFIREFFDAFFPEWADRFDFSRVEWLEQELFAEPPQGRKGVIDLLAKLPIIPGAEPRANEPADGVLHFHAEVDSSHSIEQLRQRMYDYNIHLERKLGCTVFPMAIYLGVGLEGRGRDGFQKKIWDRLVHEFGYDYVGLPGLPAEEYEGSGNLLAVAWSTLMRMKRERRAMAAVEVLQRIHDSAETPWRKYLLCEAVQAYAPLEEDQKMELNDLLLDPKREGVKAMRSTWTTEAWDKGKLEGRQELLARLFQSRFPDKWNNRLREKLKSRTEEQLDQLATELVNPAKTLQDLGLED